MKLLIVTQKIDKNDPVLGFMHAWVSKFAENFEKITVIALGVGEYSLPSNVKVLSLGKEKHVSKLKYILRFYNYIWQERNNYDKVFVHMNQEYVLLAGDMWRLMGKKVYMWRNHGYGNMWTDLAVALCHKVFCTSPDSYTAKFKKTVLMPVGVDTDFFKPDPEVTRKPNSVLFLGRISPVKKVLEFIGWIKTTSYPATIAGPILDKEYGERVLKELDDNIKYVGPVDQLGALKLYQSHEFYANKTPAGSFDKTILEALSSGCKLMVDNPAAQNLAVADHSLNRLTQRLVEELQS